MKTNKLTKNIIPFCIVFLIFVFAGCGGGSGSSSGSSIDTGDTTNVSLSITWDAPSENTDGTPLTDLAGYKIYYGTSSHTYTESVDVGSSTVATISNLSPGLWCFVATSYNTSGNESTYSTEFCDTI